MPNAANATVQSALTVGDAAPDFSMPANGGAHVSLAGLKGKNIVLYFYPKDDTPGCTLEGKDFSTMKEAFAAANAEIIGVSKDSVASHEKFCAKFDYTILLASDEGSDVCESYGVWVEKNMYGKKYMGIERATFLIDGNGKLAKIWRKVKVEGHAEEVLKAVHTLA
ncbi:MAG: peroxiredoxin [Rickettsiales bacterium]|nr:peroxiredoxin [Rickettsiales bacterium]